MKKIIYLIGLLSTMAISIGWLFIILHLPGGSEIFNYGFLAFVLIFCPIYILKKLNTERSETLVRSKYIVGFISAVTSGIAVIFKILHLQGADEILISSFLIFTLGFLPLLFLDIYKISGKISSL
jgi:hypothetical protein